MTINDIDQAIKFMMSEFLKLGDIILEEAVNFNIGIIAAGRQRL